MSDNARNTDRADVLGRPPGPMPTPPPMPDSGRTTIYSLDEEHHHVLGQARVDEVEAYTRFLVESERLYGQLSAGASGVALLRERVRDRLQHDLKVITYPVTLELAIINIVLDEVRRSR
jgi:hypothetical protein